MSTTTSSTRSSSTTAARSTVDWRYGTVLAAGTVMLIAGILQSLRGITALFTNTLYVNTPKYVFEFDTTVWGWIHLAWGVLLAVAGGLILAGRELGRALALVPVGVAIILNFVSMPVYPLWSIVLLALNTFVIWALCTAEPAP